MGQIEGLQITDTREMPRTWQHSKHTSRKAPRGDQRPRPDALLAHELAMRLTNNTQAPPRIQRAAQAFDGLVGCRGIGARLEIFARRVTGRCAVQHLNMCNIVAAIASGSRSDRRVLARFAVSTADQPS